MAGNTSGTDSTSYPGRTRPVLLTALGRAWWVLLLYGVFAILFGLLAILSPVGTAAALTWSLGLLAIIEGVISAFAWFDRDSVLPRGWLVLYAVLSLIFGVLALMNPLTMASALILLLAVWLVVGGIYRIVFAIQVRKEIEGEWLLIVSGVLAIVLGLMFVASPVAGLVVTTVWIGIAALVYGCIQIFAAFRLRRLRDA